MPKLISLSSEDKNKNNPKDHEISVEDAKKMVNKHKSGVRDIVENHRRQNGKPLKETHSVWFSKDVLDAIFEQENGCDGVRIYLGSHIPQLGNGRSNSHNNGKTCTILVGTKAIPNPDNPQKPINEDQISDNNKMAISMAPGDDVIYDLGTMCPDECIGGKL